MLASLCGKPLKHAGKRLNEQLYQDKEGNRVRLRTTNDRVLTVTASSPNPQKATIDIDDCDYVLIVMPLEKRGKDVIEGYWVPSSIVSTANKNAHETWLNGQPHTRGENQTFSIWFDEGIAESGMFRDKWENYRVPVRLRIETLVSDVTVNRIITSATRSPERN